MKYEELVQQIQDIDVSLAKRAASAVNVSLNIRNWMIGGWIVEYEQNGSDRANYGERLIPRLSKQLGIRGLGTKNLESSRRFYLIYPEISQTVSAKCESVKFLDFARIPPTVSVLSIPPIDPEALITRLSFSQIVELLKIEDPLQRRFYEIEAIQGNWSVRELKRQISSLLYQRTGFSKNKAKLIGLTNASASQMAPRDVIRDPYVFEFLNLPAKDVIEESDLEKALLDDLEAFLLELGRGFCFEGRQKRIQIGAEYYFIDLVFYHRILKCHVLIDLKTRAFEHGDAGQINTYVNYYRENEMAEDDQPPIGLLLCTSKDEALARYALGGMDENLFVSRYQTALPDPEEMRQFLVEESRRLGFAESTESQNTNP